MIIEYEMNPAFEILGLIYTSKYYNEINSEITSELEMRSLLENKKYVQYMNYWRRYVKSFHQITPLDSYIDNMFFSCYDTNFFLLLTLPLIKCRKEIEAGSFNTEDINLEIYCLYEELFNQSFDYKMDKVRLNSTKNIYGFINSTNLDLALKWRLLELMLDSKKYYMALIECVNSNISAYEHAKINSDVGLKKFTNSFSQTINEAFDAFHDLKKDIETITPIGVFMFLQIYYNKVLYCGLLSNNILDDENKDNNNRDRILMRLKALSDNSKLEIILLLKERERYNLEMAEELNLAPATMSHHMNSLSASKFVDVEKRQGKVFYVLNKKNLEYFLRDLEKFLLD